MRDENGAEEAFDKVLSTVQQIEESDAGGKLNEDLIKKKESFPYERKMTLTLPQKSHAAAQPLPTIDPLNINTKPFESCRRALFKASSGSSNFGSEKLFVSSLLEDHPLEKEIVEKYEKAHSLLAQQKKTSYALKAKNISKVRQDLEGKRETYLEMIERGGKNILASVNDPFNTFNGEITVAEEKEFRLRLIAHQTYSITPEMIMQEAILKDSTALFDEHRPMLKKEHLEAIVGAVNRYYHLLVLSSLCSEAMDLSEKCNKTPKMPPSSKTY